METITKRVIEDKTLYVKLTWKDNETDLFHIKIVGSEGSWSGHFSQEFANRYMGRVDESPKEYKANVKKALTEHCDGFSYNFINDPDDTITVTFSWKKMYQKPIVHGSVPVYLDDVPETAKDLIDSLIDANNQLQESIHNYTQKVDILRTDLKKCHQEMDKFINMKTSLELSLYEKFVQLLNSKKKRIDLLENSKILEQSDVTVEMD